jgi:hypothetical protein
MSSSINRRKVGWNQSLAWTITSSHEHLAWDMRLSKGWWEPLQNYSNYGFTKQQLCIHKITFVHLLQPCDAVAILNFRNWYHRSVSDGELDPELTYFSDEGWFCLYGHVNTQNNSSSNNNKQSTVWESESVQQVWRMHQPIGRAFIVLCNVSN